MRSPVNWAVLGLLIERPSYGYALSQRLEREYEGVLSAGESHIYKALDGLMKRGFIEEIPGSRAILDRQRSPVMYRATAEGANALQERLLEQMHEDRRKSWMFLRQLASFTQRPDMGLRVIRRMEQEYAEEATAASIAAPDSSRLSVVSGLVARLAAEESRLAIAGKMPWIRLALHEFEALADERARKETQS
jgi:DNA-binding PadR family transcriptional regulator